VAWLLRDGEVLAALEIASTRSERRRGLLGREEIEGALLLKPARSVHTIGMRFPIDVAFCDRELAVIAVRCMRRYRMSRPRLRASCVIEASAGAFDRWGLRVGDRLEVSE
jgi:uncharacterized membrane protein (UPF0127 family)